MHINTDLREWDVLVGHVKVRPLISIWLILILLLLIAVLSLATSRFLSGALPWTPESIFNAIITYLQSL
jgi:hypothetical protein